MNALEKSILATLIYYDIIDQPLTNLEIFKYLINIQRFEKNSSLNHLSLNKVIDVLKTSPALKNSISAKKRLLFLEKPRRAYYSTHRTAKNR